MVSRASGSRRWRASVLDPDRHGRYAGSLEKETLHCRNYIYIKKILQAAVVFLGFGMNLTEILAKGKQSLPIIISTIATSLIIALILYKALNLRTNNAILVGVGSSICGGSAIAATAPVVDASDEEVAQSISVIFLFNVIAALIFPTLGECSGLAMKDLDCLREQQSMILPPSQPLPQLGTAFTEAIRWRQPLS